RVLPALCSGVPPALHSFPTRRSSDLASIQLVESGVPGEPEKLRNYVGGIAQQSQRCIAILQRLRDFSRRSQPSRACCDVRQLVEDRKSTRLNSSHSQISYAVFCLKKK